jgi:hypothetical protein
LRLVDTLGLPLNFSLIASILAILTLLGAWLSRTTPWHLDKASMAWREQATWQKWLWGLLLAWLLIRLYSFVVEIGFRPLFPWDAWTTWGVKSQVWFAFKRLLPFVDSATWLSDSTHTYYTIDAWSYPPTVSLIQLWTTLAYGQWEAFAANLPWLLCAIALGIGFYGQARLWDASPLQSLSFTYLLLSLPILNTHVALAGYADLWLATIYSLAAIAFFQWLRTTDRRQGLLALMLALACPLIKAEGTIWLLTFVPALLAARLAPKSLLGIGVSLLLLMLLWFFTGGFSLRLPWLGTIQLTPHLIQIPSLGRFELGFTTNWEPFVHNLWVLTNWHLLWYLLIFLVLFSVRRIVTDRVLLLCSIQVASGFTMLFVLFFMTHARLWAEQYTSLNRLLLQMVPLLLFYGLILFNAALARPADIKLSSAAQSG